MKNEKLELFKLQFSALRDKLNTIKEQSAAIISDISEDSFISVETAQALADKLNSYQTEMNEFCQAGAELSIDVDVSISKVSDAINNYESRQSLIAERELLLDYLRLTSEASNVVEQLEHSKEVLREKCSLLESKDCLTPYINTVMSVKDKRPLEDDEFQDIVDNIDISVARAADRGGLVINGETDLSKYLDNSSVYFSRDDISSTSVTGRKSEDGEAQTTDSNPDGDEIENDSKNDSKALWKDFNGYLNDLVLTFDACDSSGLSLEETAKELEACDEPISEVIISASKYKVLVPEMLCNVKNAESIKQACEKAMQIGLLAKGSIFSDIVSGDFYALTTKGQAIFANTESKKLFPEIDPLDTPHECMTVSPDEFTAALVARAIAINRCFAGERYYLHQMNTCPEFVFASKTSEGDLYFACAGIFTQENEYEELSTLRKIICSSDLFKMTILTLSGTDAEKIRTSLDLPQDRSDRVEYVEISKYISDTENATWEKLEIVAPETVSFHVEDAEVETSEGKKPNEALKVSEFKNDLKLDTEARRTIMRLALERQVVTPMLAGLLCGCEGDSFKPACDKLVDMGYLKKYVLDGYEPLYVPSKKGLGAAKKRDAATFLKLRKTQLPSEWPSDSFSGDEVLNAICYAHTYGLMTKAFGIREYLISPYTSGQTFIVRFVSKNSDYCVSYTGIISNEPCVFSEYSEELKKGTLEKSLFVVVGVNKSHARSLLKWISKVIDNSSGSILCCYDMETEKYYDLLGNEIENIEPLGKVETTSTEISANVGETGKNPETNDDSTILPVVEEPDKVKQHDESNNADASGIQEAPSSDEEVETPQTVDTVQPEKNTELEEAEKTSGEADINHSTDCDTSSRSLFEKLLNEENPTDEKLLHAVNSLINEQNPSAVIEGEKTGVVYPLLLSKAASLDEKYTLCKQKSDMLSLAMGISFDTLEYTGERLAEVFPMSVPSDKEESLYLSAYMKAMFTPNDAHAFTLFSRCRQLKNDYDQTFPSFGMVKNLFVKLCDNLSDIPEGFSPRILDSLQDEAKSKSHIESMKKRASELKNTASIKAPPVYSKEVFGVETDFCKCLTIIEGNLRDKRNEVEDFYTQFSCGLNDVTEEYIDVEIDKNWKKIRGTGNIVASKPDTEQRKNLRSAYKPRLELLKEWLSYSSGSEKQVKKEILMKVKGEILAACSTAINALKESDVFGASVVCWCILGIKSALENKAISQHELFTALLTTGIIPLDDDGMPMLDRGLTTVRYYEPWRNVIRHIVHPILSLEEARKKITDKDSDCYENYHQLEMIEKQLKPQTVYQTEPQTVAAARKSAEKEKKEFEDELELAFTYDRIGEVEKEQIGNTLKFFTVSFFNRNDFANYRAFLAALKHQVQDISERQKATLLSRLNELSNKLKDEECPLLEEAKRHLSEESNYAVAEEYLNRIEAGEREIKAELMPENADYDNFAEFISPAVFDPIYGECVKSLRGNFREVGKKYAEKHFPKEWRQGLKDDCLDMISKWPIGTSKDAIGIGNLFKSFGFDVTGSEKIVVKASNFERFKVNVVPTSRNLPEYTHPISAFGTQMKSSINVVVFFGTVTASQLHDQIGAMNLGDNLVVLINQAVPLATRRQIAELYHKKLTGQNSYLLIDQVLFLYLALKQRTERIPAMLKCTLPYTGYQPFVRDSGATTDEMFCGRKKELSSILDPNGACVVYGGRQLGKTALLERAKSLYARPDEKRYASYCSIDKMSAEETVVEEIIKGIGNNTPYQLKKSRTIEELCDQIRKHISTGEIAGLLLLIDETDTFLKSISSDMYKQLKPLVDLRRDTVNKFKFVLAGTHNVCRAKNATSGNGIFGQMGTPLCITPLSPRESIQLISRPLKYLGFKIDVYPHIETILTKTNYYPGILQFFGYTLVQTLSSQYGDYYKAADGNPPFSLQEKQLGAIINSEDLNTSIKEKFKWSLELDNRYYMLARCVALLYYENEMPEMARDGFSAKQIYSKAKDMEIACLTVPGECDENTISILLDEMTDMGILSRITDSGTSYCLRRSSFLNIIGSDYNSLFEETVDKSLEV